MEIKIGQELKIKNLLSFIIDRRTMEPGEYINKLFVYIGLQGAERTGGNISARYNEPGAISYVVLLFPINKEIPSNDNFIFVPLLHVTNCVKSTHKGSQESLNESIKKVNEFIEQNKLTPDGASYMVMVNEITRRKGIDSVEVDIYIPIAATGQNNATVQIS